MLASGALVLGPAALEGCAGPMSQVRLGPDELRALMARLERGLGRVRDIPRGEIARHLAWQARPDLSEEVLRQTLESLVVADVARSVPVGAPIEGRLGERLSEELPVLRRSIQSHHALLTSMPSPTRARLERRVRRDPEIPTDVSGWLDRHAAELGTAGDSRALLRVAALDVKARMRRQSAGAVIDDCVSKVERIADRTGGGLALGRSPGASAMANAIWQQTEGTPPGGSRPAGPASSLAASGGAPPTTEEPAPEAGAARALAAPEVTARPEGQPRAAMMEDVEWERFLYEGQRFWSADWRRPGDEEVQIGSIMMPFGAISCGLLAIIGLVVLISGAVQNGDWDGEPRNDD